MCLKLYLDILEQKITENPGKHESRCGKRSEVERPRETACYYYFILNMVNIVEVEGFGFFFAILKLARFENKLGIFGPKME